MYIFYVGCCCCFFTEILIFWGSSIGLYWVGDDDLGLNLVSDSGDALFVCVCVQSRFFEMICCCSLFLFGHQKIDQTIIFRQKGPRLQIATLQCVEKEGTKKKGKIEWQREQKSEGASLLHIPNGGHRRECGATNFCCVHISPSCNRVIRPFKQSQEVLSGDATQSKNLFFSLDPKK